MTGRPKLRHLADGMGRELLRNGIFKAALVNSYGVLTDIMAGGYLDSSQFFSAIASGAYDPSLAPAQVRSSRNSAFTVELYLYWMSRHSSVGAQHRVFDLGGGPSILSVGAEYDRYKYRIDTAHSHVAERILNAASES